MLHVVAPSPELPNGAISTLTITVSTATHTGSTDGADNSKLYVRGAWTGTETFRADATSTAVPDGSFKANASAGGEVCRFRHGRPRPARKVPVQAALARRIDTEHPCFIPSIAPPSPPAPRHLAVHR